MPPSYVYITLNLLRSLSMLLGNSTLLRKPLWPSIQQYFFLLERPRATGHRIQVNPRTDQLVIKLTLSLPRSES